MLHVHIFLQQLPIFDVFVPHLRLFCEFFVAQVRRARGVQEVTCPVCNKPISGTQNELNTHINGCLQQVETSHKRI